MTTAGQASTTPRRFGWLLWIALAVVWFASSPLRPLLDPDEGRYAEIPREMLVTGDWVTPRLDGFKYFEKPPLQYWATAAAYSVLGINEWSARLWTIGLGFLCLPMVFFWTTSLFGRAAGCAALTALAVSPYFELIAQLNLLDPGFSFFLSGAMFAFTLAQCAARGSVAERRWMLLAWFAAALAVLSKGIVVLVLGGGTLVLYTVLERDLRPWRRLHLLPGLAVFLAVSVPWFVLVSSRNSAFLQFFFVHEHFARFLTTVHRRTEPWWYFLAMLLIGVLPWIAALPSAVRAAWFETTQEYSFKPLKFMLVFSATTLVFFSLSESKLAPYILPLMPPLTAVLGAGVAGSTRFVGRLALVNGLLMPILAAGVVVFAMRRFGYLPPVALGWLLLAALAGVLGLYALWRAGASGPPPVWATVAAAILGWQCMLTAYSVLPERSAYKLVTTVKSAIGPHTQLFTIGHYRETLSPYLQRTLTPVDFTGELEFGISEQPQLAPATEEFLARWRDAQDAVAFIPPELLQEWRERGLTGHLIGGDNKSVVVSRR